MPEDWAEARTPDLYPATQLLLGLSSLREEGKGAELLGRGEGQAVR